MRGIIVILLYGICSTVHSQEFPLSSTQEESALLQMGSKLTSVEGQESTTGSHMWASLDAFLRDEKPKVQSLVSVRSDFSEREHMEAMEEAEEFLRENNERASSELASICMQDDFLNDMDFARLREMRDALVTEYHRIRNEKVMKEWSTLFYPTCDVCHLHPATAPKIYFKERMDGVGARVTTLFGMMSVAAKYGLNLGGVVVNQEFSHGVDTHRAVDALLNINEEFYVRGPPADAMSFSTIGTMVEALKSGTVLPRAGNIYIKNFLGFGTALREEDAMRHYFNDSPTGCITPSFMQAIRSGARNLLTRPITQFAEGQMNIVIHIRRGDVSSRDKTRGQSDEFYYDLIRKIRHSFLNAEIIVFSSTEGKHKLSEFDGYRQRGCKVVLDGEPLDAWNHFAHADLFIMGKGSFSIIGGLLNSKCVVYQPWSEGWPIFSRWMTYTADMPLEDFRSMVSHCRK